MHGTVAPPAFWAGLENDPGFCAVARTWARRLGAGYALVRRALLERRPGLARYYPCPQDCGCEHQVLAGPPGEWCGVCQCEPWNCPDLRLAESDLQLWELSLPRLARSICGALGLRHRFCEMGLPGVVQAGEWVADAFPVFLAVLGRPERFGHAVGQLCARLHRRFIVVGPTDGFMNAAIEEMLARERSAFFALDRCVALTASGTLAPVVQPGELFAAFRPESAGLLTEETARGAFELVRRLDVSERLKPPTLLTVFRLYCIEQLSAARIARMTGCAKSTVLERLKLLRQKTGVEPADFRPLSLHLARMEDALTDSRARRIHRRTAALGEEEDPES